MKHEETLEKEEKERELVALKIVELNEKIELKQKEYDGIENKEIKKAQTILTQIEKAKAEIITRKEKIDGLTEERKLKAAERLEEIKKLKKDLAAAEKVKNVPIFSETAKKRLRTIMIEAKYNRRKRLDNKYVKKGKECEEAAITLYSKFRHKNFKNNTVRVSNGLLTGEIDLEDVKKGIVEEVIDVKNRYDIDTLLDKEDDEKNSKADKYQLTGYGILYPTAKKQTIANCLVNNTLDAIQMELRREEFSWNEGIVPQDRQIEIIADNVFDFPTFKKYVSLLVGVLDEEGKEAFESFVEIPEKERVIEISQEKDLELEEAVIKRLQDCRVYMAEKWGED